jgi:hypothetical protein
MMATISLEVGGTISGTTITASGGFVGSFALPYYEKVNLSPAPIVGFQNINTLTNTAIPAGTYLANFNGSYTTTLSNPLMDVIDVRTALLNLPITGIIPNIIPNGYTILPGVYDLAAAAISTPALASITFDGSGLYVIKTTGAMSTGASTTFLLSNGASASDIFWVIDGAFSLGANTNFIGTVISLGAISFGDACIVDGRCLSITTGAFAATNTLTTTLTRPIDSLFMSLKSAVNFAILTNNGNMTITNSGIFTINGNIGSATGVYAGGSANVNGVIEIPIMPTSIFTIGIYENSILIPKTFRSLMGDCNSISISCIIISVGTNSYQIGINVISGTLYINEAIFSMVKIS